MDAFKGFQKSLSYEPRLASPGMDLLQKDRFGTMADIDVVQLPGWADHSLCLADLPVHQRAIGPSR